ncbi:MAG: 2-polyprenyl-3-methyl-6-methoxy-1,4-benzoquinone monooxygenase [gamma proteobacterium symbiont of Taylorina sp.]|nr:2-polyprenyl-3-methyl-6-methoxy-1,4-benzoquinone monooxygenase [gamma proteobacterium symbiont of Taylorina sp.]
MSLIERQFSAFDHFLINIDTGMRTMFGAPEVTERKNPSDTQLESDIDGAEKELAGRLMRINHAGEVSAQGLYQGQALTARLPEVRQQMQRAAQEENDHLAWCEKRCKELGTHVSYLSPFWYFGSLTIGAIAGRAGDQWSLGFVAETEHQVVRHLDQHLAQLSPDDHKSRAILEQMKIDELQHAVIAENAGAANLPAAVKMAMKVSSKVMTNGAFYL